MKIKTQGFFIFMCLIANIFTVYAEEPLTWENCVEQALKNHPDLVSAAEKVKQAKRDKDIQVSAALPQVDGDASITRTSTSTKNTGGEYTDQIENSYTYGVTGQQLLFDGFKTVSEVSGAEKTVQAERYNYAVVSSNIRLNLRSAFVELMKAQELISLTGEIRDRRAQNLALVKLRYEAGREHKGSLLTADADLASAEFEVRQAERGVTLAKRELSKELGSDKLKDIRANGEFSIKENYDLKPDLERLVGTVPFLMELAAKKEAARYGLQSEQADFFPQVYLNASADKKNEDWPPRYDGWSAGFSASLPLFEGGSRVAEISKARAALNQAKADERSGKNTILVTLESTWKDLQDAMLNVSVQKKFLEATEERAKITTAQYETGLTYFDDWIIIENNLVAAKKIYLNAEANMLTAEAYWIQAIGGTLEYDKK